MYLTIGRGRGYRPAEENKSPDQPIGVIPIDSIFSPVRRVAYSVEQARVGQRTDYDKLTLDIETDGSIDPQAALREAAEILISPLAIFTDEDRIEELRAGPGGMPALDNGAGAGARRSAAPAAAAAAAPMDDILIEELELGVRSYNCLKRAGIQTVGDLVSKSEGELNAIPNFGKKSIDEVIETLDAARPRACATTRISRRHAPPEDRDTSSPATPRTARRCCNLCIEVIDHERIKTTEAKAKAVKPEIEKLITLAKQGRPARAPPGDVDAPAGQVHRLQAVRGDRPALRRAPGRLHPDPEARSASVGLDRDGLPRAGLSARAPWRSLDCARVRRHRLRRLGRQPGQRTVQGELERALGIVLRASRSR